MWRVRIDSIWDWSHSPTDSKRGFHATTAKDEAGRGEKKKTGFQLVDFWSKPSGLSQSIASSRIWVIKDFSRTGILEIGIESPLSMLADRESSMKLCFTLIYCIIPFDRELFSATEAVQCVWYTGSNRGRLKVHEVNREAVTGCELSVKNGTALKPPCGIWFSTQRTRISDWLTDWYNKPIKVCLCNCCNFKRSFFLQ